MDSNLNVTFFLGHLLQGGAERVVTTLANEMANNGMNVFILSYYDADPVYPLNDDVKLIRIQSETDSENIIRNILYIRKIFKERKGIIYSFIAVFNIIAVIANFGLSTKLVVADRNDPARIPKKTIIRWIRNIAYRFANVVVAQTESNAKYFRRRMKNPIKVIYNPLEMGIFGGKAIFTPKKNEIVTVGRLVRQKNQRMLIRAFANVRKELNDYRLVIYGDGKERANLETYAKSMGVSEYVSFAGNHKDIFSKISTAKLFVLTSDFEGMPNALIEAMGLGLPVISTKVSGAVDLIEDRVNGELIPLGADELLKERMIAILSDDNLQRRYAENAKKICEKLSKDKIVKEWVELYEQ